MALNGLNCAYVP